MKTNTKLYFSVLLCALFLLTGCNDYTGGNTGNGKDRPDIVLTYPELISMLQHYDETRTQPLTAINRREDTRINSFKLQDLKDYIAYVEKESKRKGIKLTSINFISAAYPDNYQLDKNKSGYQTLIMMPATTIGGEKNVSFDPFKSEKNKPLSLKEILENYNYNTWLYDKIATSKSKKKSSRSAQKSGDDEFSSGANRAGVTPPF